MFKAALVSVAVLALILFAFTRQPDGDWAQKFFGELGYARVLDSGSGKSGSVPWEHCTFSVVQLSPEAPDFPTRIYDRHKGVFEKEEWKPTPMTMDSGETSYRHWCEPRVRRRAFEVVFSAMSDTGGWYQEFGRGMVGYSKPHNVAFLFWAEDPRF